MPLDTKCRKSVAEKGIRTIIVFNEDLVIEETR